jgi:hypothetical protein
MKDVAIKVILVEVAVFALLVMTISSFSHFLAVDFPRVIIFTIIALVAFPALSLLMLRLECLNYIRSLNPNTVQGKRPWPMEIIKITFADNVLTRFRSLFLRK